MKIDGLFSRIFLLVICSSKDATVKLWDLDTQHCFATVVGHSREVRLCYWLNRFICASLCV